VHTITIPSHNSPWSADSIAINIISGLSCCKIAVKHALDLFPVLAPLPHLPHAPAGPRRPAPRQPLRRPPPCHPLLTPRPPLHPPSARLHHPLPLHLRRPLPHQAAPHQPLRPPWPCPPTHFWNRPLRRACSAWPYASLNSPPLRAPMMQHAPSSSAVLDETWDKTDSA